MESKRIKLTKRLLKEALIELLEEKDIEYITVKELSERADINRSTFYTHYKDITEFIEEIVSEFLEKAPFLRGVEVVEEEAIKKYIDFIKENEKIYSALYERNLFTRYFVKTIRVLYKNNEICNGKMRESGFEKYMAVSLFCYSGANEFIHYCLNSEIPSKKQAQILCELFVSAQHQITEK